MRGADPERAGRYPGRNYINLRGEVLPFVRLQHYFDVEGARGRRENIVVVSHGGKKSGLVVDELLGEFRPSSSRSASCSSACRISGSTILGGGEVALILDIPLSFSTPSSRSWAS